MNANWLRPNLYVVQNGKVVPRSSTPEQKKNYRYIHYQPLNNPSPDDYFRETISRLQKENNALKAQLATKLEEDSSATRLSAGSNKFEDQAKYEARIASLIQELTYRDNELADKNQQLVNKDKRILELGNQNTRLHLRINGVVKQIEALNFVMSKKDEQIMNKKQQIEQYCRTLQKFTIKEKEEQKTMFSQNQLTTPRIQEKEEEEDEFYSMEYNSLYDRQSVDRRYMTPNHQSFRLDDPRSHLYQSQTHFKVQEMQSGQNSRINTEQQKRSVENDLNWNLKNWSQWASQPNIKNSFSIDLVRQQIDPAAGGLSGLLSPKK